jgi:hypothetical protein
LIRQIPRWIWDNRPTVKDLLVVGAIVTVMHFVLGMPVIPVIVAWVVVVLGLATFVGWRARER